MAIRIVRLGTPRGAAEGVRLGTVRRPPRGVRKADYARRDFFDAWLPELAPSARLVKWIGEAPASDSRWATFTERYRREMGEAGAARLLDVLARLSRDANLAVGCYCENYHRCHRSILEQLLREHGARVAANPS